MRNNVFQRYLTIRSFFNDYVSFVHNNYIYIEHVWSVVSSVSLEVMLYVRCWHKRTFAPCLSNDQTDEQNV